MNNFCKVIQFVSFLLGHSYVMNTYIDMCYNEHIFTDYEYRYGVCDTNHKELICLPCTSKVVEFNVLIIWITDNIAIISTITVMEVA